MRIWTVQIPREGTYEIEADGNVDGYISPRLAFGRDGSRGWLVWLFGGLFVVGLLALFGSLMWSARAGKRARPLAPEELMTFNEPTWSRLPPTTPETGHAPSDQGIRLEQIRQLAALRDSGALTDDEYRAEKRRILDS